jgi:hypothetical protein
MGLVVLTGALCLGLPASAWAGCGGVQHATPARRAGAPLPPLAIGDSSMLLALPDLARRGFAVNAHGCRQFPEALALLRGLRHAHRLPYLVVIALGADGTISRADIGAALRVLGTQRRLVLVTPLELGGGAGPDARLVRSADRLYRGRIYVLDWVRHSRGHPGWFQPDGVHLTFAGATAFARFLGGARPLAQRGPTAFGSLIFSKRSSSVRIPATLRLTRPRGWVVTIDALRARSGPPGFKVRRHGACATSARLIAAGRRDRQPTGTVAHLAGLVPAGATLLRRATVGRARVLVWRTADGAIGGGWSVNIGDPFPDDGDHGERAYLDVSAIARPLAGAPACAEHTTLVLLTRLRRLSA